MRQLSLPQKLLLGLCGLHLVVNVVWLTLNTAPIMWDQAGHTRLAVEFARFFQGTLRKDVEFINISSYYPPLTHLIASVFILALGASSFAAALPITLYFVALLVGLFLLARKMTHNEWVGLATAAFVSFFPPIYENSRSFLLDIPLLTLLVFAWYFLLRSHFFERRKEMFAFAAICVGVLLTKWIGVVFLVVPLVYMTFERFRRGWKAQHLTTLAISAVIIAVCSAPWYLSNLNRLIEIGRLASQGEITDPQSPFSLDNLLFYFRHILNFQLTLWPALIALVAVVLYVLHKKAPYKWLLITYFVTGYVFFTFISNKDIRYTLPLLPVLALIPSYLLVKWWKTKYMLGSVVIAASLIFLATQFAILSFHLLPTYQRAWNLGPLGWVDYVNTGDIVVKYPKRDTTPNKAILEFLTLKHRKEGVNVMVGIDQPNINPSTLDLFITLRDYWQVSLEAPFDRTQFNSESEMVSYINRFRYLLVPTGEVGPDAVRHKKALQQIQEYVLVTNSNQYEVVKEFPLDSGEKLYLLRKI